MLKSLYPCGVHNGNRVILNRLIGANKFSIRKPDFKNISDTNHWKTGHA